MTRITSRNNTRIHTVTETMNDGEANAYCITKIKDYWAKQGAQINLHTVLMQSPKANEKCAIPSIRSDTVNALPKGAHK